MNREQHQKVTPHHLKRAALLYVRQSTMRQVFETVQQVAPSRATVLIAGATGTGKEGARSLL